MRGLWQSCYGSILSIIIIIIIIISPSGVTIIIVAGVIILFRDFANLLLCVQTLMNLVSTTSISSYLPLCLLNVSKAAVGGLGD